MGLFLIHDFFNIFELFMCSLQSLLYLVWWVCCSYTHLRGCSPFILFPIHMPSNLCMLLFYVESIWYGFLCWGCSPVSQVNIFFFCFSLSQLFIRNNAFINFSFAFARAFTVLALMGEFLYGKSMRALMRKTSLKLLEELS